MVTRNQTNEHDHLEMLSIKLLVLENYLVRKLEFDPGLYYFND